MRPGGWVELQDVDGAVHTDDSSVPEDWPLKRLTDLLVEAFAHFGTKANAAEFGREYLQEAGFVNIQHNYIKLPYGTWPRDKYVLSSQLASYHKKPKGTKRKHTTDNV